MIGKRPSGNIYILLTGFNNIIGNWPTYVGMTSMFLFRLKDIIKLLILILELKAGPAICIGIANFD
jgi:hypothetical protein